MHTAPADLSVSELRTALVTGWRIEPSSITYASVGFGSHHWTVVEPSSRRWFVTADAIADSSTRLADLNAALRTALALRRDAGLDFVGAPVQRLDGRLLQTSGRYAIAVITSNGPVMIDWDTVRLGPPTRDLWMIGGHQRYTALTGRVPSSEQLDFYRLRWDLADLCSSGSWFCRPHEATADTELSWHGAVAICKRLSAGTPGPPWAIQS
jgi:hypothetical protein